jgi:hypothetical protein
MRAMCLLSNGGKLIYTGCRRAVGVVFKRIHGFQKRHG